MMKTMITSKQLSLSLMGSLSLVMSSSAFAQGTTTYEYDALGRLIGTNTSGGANDGLDHSYEYDAAGNRKRVIVTGSDNVNPPNDGSTGGVIVLPINGFW